MTALGAAEGCGFGKGRMLGLAVLLIPLRALLRARVAGLTPEAAAAGLLFGLGSFFEGGRLMSHTKKAATRHKPMISRRVWSLPLFFAPLRAFLSLRQGAD